MITQLKVLKSDEKLKSVIGQFSLLSYASGKPSSSSATFFGKFYPFSFHLV